MKIPFRNNDKTYGLVSQLLHWLVAVLIVAQFIWAWRIQLLSLGRHRFDLVNEHKSIGLTILALMLVRLIWRYFNPPPPLPATMTVKERHAAHTLHRSLYVILLLLPPVGWAMSSAAGFVVSWFDIFDLPALVSQNDELKAYLKITHAVLAWILAILVAGHIGAALRHHFVKKDDILKRMLPLWRRE